MGKLYYCDFCERSFADGAENRKKHLASIHHQKLRKTHYEMFKSASIILQENKLKNPCRKFHQSGHCDFGSGCKYSHLTPKDIQELEKQAYEESIGVVSHKERVVPDIDEWLKAKTIKTKKSTSSDSSNLQPVLPTILSSIPNLPPSLIPCRISEIINCSKDISQQWG